MKLMPRILPRNEERRQAATYNAVLRYEAKLGGQLFGPIPKGHRREFFCLDKHTWVWHEESIDGNGQRQIVTTYYHVRPDGILKSQGSHTYRQIAPEETRNFFQATRLYGEIIPGALQGLLHQR